MSSFHRNIFSYFRGTSQSEQDCVRQLEDNTTKALVNTLEHSVPAVVAEFLRWLGIASPSKVRFAQQKASLGDELVRKKPQRLLLAIVGSEGETNQKVCDQLPAGSDCEGTSRPDAWIYGDDFAVLIESKVGTSALLPSQMACHWQVLRPKEIRVVTWAEVHRFFQRLSQTLSDSQSRWITNQLKEYLEWTGMTQFAGFREEMFEFFVAAERDPDTQRWVRSAVDGLAERVLNGKNGLKAFDPWYSSKHIGNLPSDADHFWVAFGPDKSFSKSAHQTVSLYEHKLDVFVNVELLPAVKKLRRKIGVGDFREVVSKLPGPFTVCIHERRKTKRPRIYDYYPVAEIESGFSSRQRHGLKNPQSPAYDYVERMLTDIKYPYLSVRRSFSRVEVLKLSERNGDPLVAEVLATLKGFHPLVEFINN